MVSVLAALAFVTLLSRPVSYSPVERFTDNELTAIYAGSTYVNADGSWKDPNFPNAMPIDDKGNLQKPYQDYISGIADIMYKFINKGYDTSWLVEVVQFKEGTTTHHLYATAESCLKVCSIIRDTNYAIIINAIISFVNALVADDGGQSLAVLNKKYGANLEPIDIAWFKTFIENRPPVDLVLEKVANVTNFIDAIANVAKTIGPITKNTNGFSSAGITSFLSRNFSNNQFPSFSAYATSPAPETKGPNGSPLPSSGSISPY